jgi:hypothetical protein
VIAASQEPDSYQHSKGAGPTSTKATEAVGVNLQEEIDKRAQEIHTDGYSTILRFVGVLNADTEVRDAPQPLVASQYLERLAGLYYDSDLIPNGKAGAHSLDDAQRRVFKRARLDFQIVEKESDEQAKYDLFQYSALGAGS